MLFKPNLSPNGAKKNACQVHKSNITTYETHTPTHTTLIHLPIFMSLYKQNRQLIEKSEFVELSLTQSLSKVRLGIK